MSEVRADYDGAWKEGVEQYFEAFLAFFFPDIQAEIDWERGYDFLDQELQQLMRESEMYNNFCKAESPLFVQLKSKITNIFPPDVPHLSQNFSLSNSKENGKHPGLALAHSLASTIRVSLPESR